VEHAAAGNQSDQSAVRSPKIISIELRNSLIIGVKKLAAELEASLREFASAGAAELCKNGARLAPLSKLSWEVRGSDDKPLLHIWSEQYNLTRRVIAITDHSDARLVLAVERFGRPRPDRLEFVRIDFERSAWELSREEFCEWLKGLLASQFPDETVESATISADLEHSLSGNYVRGLTKRGSRYEAFLAVPDGESQDTVNNSLTFALLWLDRLRNGSQRGTVGGVRLIVPKETCSVVAHRFAALEPGLAIELYERDPARDSLERIDPRRAGNLRTWLIPRRESEALLAQARAQVEPIVASDPQAIAIHPCIASREVVLRYRGLAFARWDDGAIFFGCNDMRAELTPASRAAFERMMQDLESIGIHWHRIRVTLYIGRRRNAGWSLWCATRSLAWTAFSILALFMRKCLPAAARSTASLNVLTIYAGGPAGHSGN
jgi:hypothetical protein